MKSATRALFATLFFLLYLGAPAFATTYYVKTGGNDNAAGTSDATAWAHCPGMSGWSGSTTPRSGDIVLFRSQDTWTSSSNPAVLNATAGVTYDGGSYGSGTRAKFQKSGNINCVIQIIVSDVTIKNIEADANSKNGNGIEVNYNNAYQDIANVTINNCIVHNVGGINSWWYGIAVNSYGGNTSTNVIVSNNKVYDTCHEGITLYPESTSSSNQVINAIIRGNEVYNTGVYNPAFGTGILLKNNVQGALIEFNYTHDNAAFGIVMNSDLSVVPTGVTIRYNIIKDNHGWGYYTFGIGTTTDIYGNLFINNGTSAQGRGGHVMMESSMAGSAFKFYNNTFYATTNGATSERKGFANEGNGSYTIELKNNIFYSDVSGVTPVRDIGGTRTHSNNLVFNGQGASAEHVNNGLTYNRAGVKAWEATGQNTVPTFKNPSNLPTGFSGTYGTDMVPNNDGLSISSGDAIDNGTSLASTYNGAINLSGTNSGSGRPQGSSWDIGAYEFRVQISRPSPPANFRIISN